MPSVLIAGCGYVGIATAKRFLAQGWNVTGWTRSDEIADGDLTIQRCAVDLRDPEDVRKNFFPCDLVVHCASSGGGGAAEYRRLYRDGAANLVSSFPRARILFTSSTSVYPQHDGGWVDEDSPAEPASAKGKILREAETIVLGTGGIVLRLAGIYGPGRSFFRQSILNGTASLSDRADRYVNQIHRDDIASAILLVARRTTITPPRIFNVVDDAPSPRGEILTWLSTQMKKPLVDSAAAFEGRRADSDKRVSNAKLRALGWSPQYSSYKEGLLTVGITPSS